MYRVLIVDDEKIIRIGIRNLINWEEQGFKVVAVAGDGNQALQVIDIQGVDLVITDIKMPNMDGIEFIKCLNERKFSGEVIMLTNYGEFELARECLRYGAHDYLLKVTLRPSELVKTLEEAKRKLEKKEIRHEVFEEEKEVNQQDICSMEQLLKKQVIGNRVSIEERFFSTAYIFLLLRYVQSKFEQEKGKDKSFENYKNPIENIIAEVLPEQGTYSVLFEEEWCLCAIPSEYFRNNREQIHKTSFQIQNLVKLYTNIKVIGVISRPLYTTKEFIHSLSKSMIVSELVFYKGYDQVLEEDMYEHIKPYMATDYRLFKGKIYQAIKNGDYTSTIDVFEQCISFICDHYIPQKEVEEMLNQLLHGIVLEYGIYLENDKNKLDEIIENYRKSTLILEMQREINALIYTICTSIVHMKNKDYRKEIKEIMEYIEKHIGEKITLASIAHQVNMNESYISRLFKNETGINIINYINIRKMEKAKELLKEQNMIVKDVAYALGFDEQSYFNRMFNKYFGMNPKDYKNA